MTAGLDALSASVLGLTGRGRPAVATPPFARFVLDRTELAALEAEPSAEDQPSAAHPGGGAVRPGSLLLRGRLRGGSTAPLRCRPLFPGRLVFTGGQNASTPAPDEVSRAAFAGWDTTGRIMVDLLHPLDIGQQFAFAPVTAVDPGVLRRWQRLTATLGPGSPTRMWFETVRIPAAFLFDALPVLAPAEMERPGAGGEPGPRHRQRISEFLRGTWAPVLGPPVRTRAGGDDPVGAAWMPQIVPDAGGAVQIRVTAARAVQPYDGNMSELVSAAGTGTVDPDHPAHPANATVPARLVYQTVAAARGLRGALPDSCGPAHLTYSLLRTTRVWTRGPDCSVHFPAHVLTLHRADGTVEVAQRLASHGLFFHGREPDAPAPAGTTATLDEASGDPRNRLRVRAGGWHVVGGEPRQSWAVQGGDAPVPVDLDAPGGGHLVARRPMSLAMVASDIPPPDVGEDRCTYVSMRRSVRALVDNRIAGGRLSGESRALAESAKALADAEVAEQDGEHDKAAVLRAAAQFATARAQALAATSAVLIDKAMRPHATHFRTWRGRTPASLLLHGAPDPTAHPGTARALLPFWEAFFPGPAPAPLPVAAGPRSPRRLTLGKAAYQTWQSAIGAIGTPRRKRAFPARAMGTGAPGALVLTGLASAYHQGPPLGPLPMTPEERDAAVGRLTDGLLQPHGLLQWWRYYEEGYLAVTAGRKPRGWGHSPVFHRVTTVRVPPAPEQTVVELFDQHGLGTVVVARDAAGLRQLGYVRPRDYFPEVWIAAQWAE